MKTKNFSLAFASVLLLLAFASAVQASSSVLIFSWYENTDANTYTIIDGQDVNFAVSADSILETSMNVKVQLLDSSDRVIGNLIDVTTTKSEYSTTYTLSKAVYQNAGTYKIKSTVTGKSGQTSTYTLKLTVNPVIIPPVDTTAPVITILGSNPATVQVGTVYTDAGARATDNIDGDITSRIVTLNNVNSNAVGTYTVRYTVADMAGNIATAVRIVNVVSNPQKDTTPPVILSTNPANNAILPAGTTSVLLTVNTDESASCKMIIGNPIVDYNTAPISEMTNDASGLIHTQTLTGLSDNHSYTDYIKCKDTAGNVMTNNYALKFSVAANSANTTQLTMTVNSPIQDEEYTDSLITFEVVLNKMATVVYNLNNDGNVTMSQSGTSFTFVSDELDLDDDDYTVVFYATDAAGNSVTQTVDFTINTKDKNKNTVNGVTSVTPLVITPPIKKKPLIDLSDETKNNLKWWQKVINWIVMLFGGNPVYY